MRTGLNPNASKIELPILLRLFRNLYISYLSEDFFQEAFGYTCVDNGDVAGTLGHDVEAQFFLKLRKTDLWPIGDKCLEYSEDDLFDVIEFLYDFVSKPSDGYYHSFNDCGWHYSEFDHEEGQKKFQSEINAILQDYHEGYELSDEGEILATGAPGLQYLFDAKLSSSDPENIDTRIQSAILKFRRYRSTLDDRRDSVRDLADVLEFLRVKLKTVLLKKDERDLFKIANSFGIRHHNEQQQTDYDKSIWYSWMFHYYLATIHAALRLIEIDENND